MTAQDSPQGARLLPAELTILQAMAESLEDYLLSDQLMWPLSGRAGMMPRLTIGGLLMRQHRIDALRDAFTVEQSLACNDALHTIDITLKHWSVRTREKMLQEWAMRTNLLEQFIRDCDDPEIKTDCAANWPSHAEQRVMLHHLQIALSSDDAASDRDAEQVRIDRALRRILAEGESDRFLWSAAFEAAYTQDVFWWLWISPPDGD